MDWQGILRAACVIQYPGRIHRSRAHRRHPRAASSLPMYPGHAHPSALEPAHLMRIHLRRAVSHPRGVQPGPAGVTHMRCAALGQVARSLQKSY